MSKLWFFVLCMVLVVAVAGTAAQDEDPVQIIFMHHSTGAGVMNDGGVRAALTDLDYEFWDHDYNEWGLSDPMGNSLGVNWNVPDDNTDPDGWYAIFGQPITDPPSNTLSNMLEFDVIIFKSCFPSSAIYDEDLFDAYKEYYLSIRDVIDYYPDKLFIPWTTPPLVPNETNTEEAARARRWAEYLTSDEYLEGHANIAIFDFFSLMADEDGYLSAEYRSDEWDSHPSWTGNLIAGPVLVEFVHQAIEGFEPGDPIERPEVIIQDVDIADAEADADHDTDGDGEDGSIPERLVGGDVVEDFEGGPAYLSQYWWFYFDGTGSEPELTVAEPGYSGDYALEFTFEVPVDHYMGMGTDFHETQDWSDADGLQFVWRSVQEDTVLAILLFVYDPEDPGNPTLFETHLLTPGEEWAEEWIYWEDFAKPEWMGDAGVDAFDPAKVTGISMDVGSWEQAQSDTIWLDDFRLMR